MQKDTRAREGTLRTYLKIMHLNLMHRARLVVFNQAVFKDQTSMQKDTRAREGTLCTDLKTMFLNWMYWARLVVLNQAVFTDQMSMQKDTRETEDILFTAQKNHLDLKTMHHNWMNWTRLVVLNQTKPAYQILVQKDTRVWEKNLPKVQKKQSNPKPITNMVHSVMKKCKNLGRLVLRSQAAFKKEPVPLLSMKKNMNIKEVDQSRAQKMRRYCKVPPLSMINTITKEQ